MKPVLPLVLCGLLALTPIQAMASGAEGDAETPQNETEKMGQQVKEIGQEMTRVFIQKLQAFLDEELQRLRQSSPKTIGELKQQLDAIESQLKAHPNDAAGHAEVGEIYDRLGDGANAIIHMRQAEALRESHNDVAGLAEARRNLRHYYFKYGFKPEDFELNR